MNRRGFLTGILAAGTAPAIVTNVMPLWLPKREIWHSGGIIKPRTLHLIVELPAFEELQPLKLYFGRSSITVTHTNRPLV